MKGFTLIELLVVVVIIGILSSIALPQYVKAVERARAAEAVIIIKALQDAMQRHIQEFPGEYPTTRAQIADVKLTGGRWVSDEDGDTCFVTDNFTYDISLTKSINAVRGDHMDNCEFLQQTGVTKYYVQVPKVPEYNSKIKCVSTKTGEYDYICSSFGK